MSKFPTVYQYLLDEIGTQFPSKIQIPRPASLIDNSIALLRDSWGLRFDGANLQTQEFKTLVDAWDFTIILIREVVHLDSDPVIRNEAVKSLGDDVSTIRQYLYDIDNIGIPDDIDQLILGSTGPEQELLAGKNNFIFIETSITTRIREVY